MAADGERTRKRLRSAAHDLRNLAYRLTFLGASLERDMAPSDARTEAGDLLTDTTARMNAIAEDLITVSPVHLDLTNYEALGRLKEAKL